MVKIRASAIKSAADLKKRLKKGGGGGAYLTRIPADGSITVRFLSEPDGPTWVEYFEHFNDAKKFFPCSDDCDACREGDKPSKRFLTSAVDVQENKVAPLVVPASAMTSLNKKYEKYATLLDRDYEISRSGAGFDTEYEVTPEPPSKMNLARFDPLDLLSLLQSQLDGEEDEEDEDEAPNSKKGGKSRTRPSPPRDDDDGILDDEEDEDDDDAPPRRKIAVKKNAVPKSTKATGKKIIKKRG